MLGILGDTFGKSKNGKGYWMLPPYLRIIQGDGVSYETVREILDAMDKAGWSADNIALGSGGALLQKLNRDTQKCAFKCSYAIVDGKGVRVVSDTLAVWLLKSITLSLLSPHSLSLSPLCLLSLCSLSLGLFLFSLFLSFSHSPLFPYIWFQYAESVTKVAHFSFDLIDKLLVSDFYEI